MKNKIFTFTLMLLITVSPFFLKGQNQVSKSGFFKSLSYDPVITLHNNSNSPMECITVNYKINGGQLQHYKFGGTLPAHTSVDIFLPRMQVSNGMHFFDASVSSKNGESLKNETFAKGISITLSPGSGIDAIDNKKDDQESGCDCENGKGLDEAISFWTSVYINDSNKLDAFASTTKGKIWFQGEWNERKGLENEWNSADFQDPSNKDRMYRLNVSTESISESVSYFNLAEDETSGLDLNSFKCSAYPNPFTDNVNIEYSISQISDIDIVISDMTGKIIAQPVSGVTHGKGKYTFEFKGGKLPPGVYYCTIRYDNKKETIKLVKN